VSSSSPSSDQLSGSRFLIGGGSRGLGLGVARELVRGGAEVLLVSRSLEHLVAAQGELGSRCLTAVADLSSPTGGQHAGKVVEKVWPEGLDGALVNSGGPPRGTALELDDNTWRAAYELLVGGPLRLVRCLRPRLRDGSALLFIASSSVREPVPSLDASNVLRPAVAALVRALARELAPSVRVNALAPGRFATDRAAEGDERRARAEGLSVAEVRARSETLIPLRRYGDPAELGRAAAFLLSPASSYITGATLHVDGGLVKSAP
jgi:3-oxoacyl-[acyl-carrier protein] reductase